MKIVQAAGGIRGRTSAVVLEPSRAIMRLPDDE